MLQFLVDPFHVIDTITEGSTMSCVKRAKFCASGPAFDFAGFCRFCRLAFPVATAAHVASLAGATTSTAEKWLRGETRPSGEHFAALIAAFGPAFVAAAVPGAKAWAEPAAHHEQITQVQSQLDKLLAEA